MQSIFGVLCLLTTLGGVAFAWYNKNDNTVYGGWTPDRRSIRWCRRNGDKCLMSSQCCQESAICRRATSYGFGQCEAKSKESNFFDIPTGGKYGTKKTHEECVDSFECADQCCRVVKLGRGGYRQTCGKPRRFGCVGRGVNEDNTNDIFGDY